MKGLSFDPRQVAKLEIMWWRAHHEGNKESLFEGLVQHNAELYGLTKEEAQQVVQYMIAAVKHHDTRDWESAIAQMALSYEIIRDKLSAQFDPEEAARLEVGWWELHDKLEFEQDKTPLAQAFAKLFACVFEVSEETLQEAGRLKAEATRQHDLAEAEDTLEEDVESHWELAEQALQGFYTELLTVVSR